MFEKNMKIAYLVDFYGDVLDEHTRALMEAYYEDDLSLAEIAASEGVSRQGIRHTIKRGEEELTFLENRLGLAKKYAEIENIGDTLAKVATAVSERYGEGARDITEEILNLKEKLLNKGV